MEAAAEVDVPRRAGVGEERFGFEAQLVDERPELRRRPHGVRSQLQEIAVDSLRSDDPARPVGRLEEDHVLAARGERAGPDEPGEARADDRGRHPQKGWLESTRSASARKNVGRSFRPGVRRKFGIPAFRAASAKSWSTS